jgi:hypothetical protein
MKTPAIIASLTVIGSIAYAAGSQGVAGKQSPPMPSGSQMHSMQEEMPQARTAQAATDCPSGESLVWFSETPRVVPCANGSASQPFVTARLIHGVSDVNGDGINEYLGLFGNATTDVIADGTPTFAASKIWVNRINPATGAPTRIRDEITVVPENFGVWVQAMYPGTTQAMVRMADGNGPYGMDMSAGFRDMDGDGDLDYLVVLFTEGGGFSNLSQVWFENIGYEKPAPPVAADLNHDGRVDGADLGLLLVAWGPNP